MLFVQLNIGAARCFFKIRANLHKGLELVIQGDCVGATDVDPVIKILLNFLFVLSERLGILLPSWRSVGCNQSPAIYSPAISVAICIAVHVLPVFALRFAASERPALAISVFSHCLNPFS